LDRQAADQGGDRRADAARIGRAILREPNLPMLKWPFQVSPRRAFRLARSEGGERATFESIQNQGKLRDMR
jgi:hypothetical protein